MIIPKRVRETLGAGCHSAPDPARNIKHLPCGARCGTRLFDVSCLIGESGSGKSVIPQGVMGLLPSSLGIDSGVIELQGENLLAAAPQRLRSLRGTGMTMVFQEPMTALNPVMTCGAQIDELLVQHAQMSALQRHARILKIFTRVQLPDPLRIYASYPHQLSGGQRQRIVIAMATVLRPALLICDEPTTALDVTTQAQILRLIDEMRRGTRTAVLFITHDFGVVADIADQVVVLRLGEVVEQGSREAVFSQPREAYTRMLLAAVPPAGSGKSTVARCLARLHDTSGGSLRVDGHDYANLDRATRSALWRKIQIVFQDLYRSLNPRRTVGGSIIEGPLNFGIPEEQAWQRAAQLMEQVQLPAHALRRYPNEFSGGVHRVLSDPQHAYTRSLIDSLPGRHFHFGKALNQETA